MAIEKMSLWSVEGKTQQLDAALAACCESGVFQFSSPGKTRGLAEQNPYRVALSRLGDLATNLKISANNRPFD